MSLEIEAKMAVQEFAPIHRRLADLGATYLHKRLETNEFFDTPHHALRRAGKGLRLRRNHDLRSGADEHVITFKGPLQNSALKSREEIELVVADAQDATRLLGALGFEKVLSFEKRRESWELKRCKVELDELPHLGLFVEVEGPDEKAVMSVRDTLGLAEAPLIKTGYASLIADYLAEHGLRAGEAKFI